MALGALWLAMLAGLTQGAALLAWAAVTDAVIPHSPDVVWMAPIANAVLLLPLGLVLGALARRWPRPFTEFRVVTAISIPALLAPLLLIPRVGALPLALLALGLASRVGAWSAKRPGGLARAARRWAGATALLVAAAGAVVHGGRALAERRAAARLPAAVPGAPNVLLLILDTVRAASLGVYGFAAATSPQLERLAQRAVTYDLAIAPSPWTLPTIATLLTGAWPHQHGADWRRPLTENIPTLAERLAERGYRSAGFTANLVYGGREWGLARGFGHYEDYRPTPGEIALASSLTERLVNHPLVRRLAGHHDVLGRSDAAELTRRFLRWEATRGGRPFFAMINYFDAHEPYLPPPAWAARFAAPAPRDLNQIRLWRHEGARIARERMSPAEVEADLGAYHAAIAYLDHHVGRLLEELDRRGSLRNTIVVVVGDHGEQFGEHHLFTHGNSLYLPAIRVPLLLVAPGRVPAGTRVARPVSLRDVPATVLALTGAPANLPGELLPFADTGRAAGPVAASVSWDRAITGRSPLAAGDLVGAVAGSLSYIRSGGGIEELYDVARDPEQLVNLAGSPDHAAAVRALRDTLAGWGFPSPRRAASPSRR